MLNLAKKNIWTIRYLFVSLMLILLLLSCHHPVSSSSIPQYEDGVSFDNSGRMTITQYGISWSFDKSYPYGRFINGDYYIIGPARLVSIYPEPGNGRNGSMINPAVGMYQAYDSRAEGYDGNLCITLPRILNQGESLVSAISNQTPESRYSKDFANCNVTTTNARLTTAAILTCLDTHPADNTFRPPYIGTSKPLYTFNGSAASQLPALTFDLTSVMWSYSWFTSIFETPYDYYLRGLKRPWIIHQYDWLGREIHPLDNMKNYHADMDSFFGQASLLLMADPEDSISKREELLIYYLQCGIDYYHMCTQGHGDASFNAWPVIFTGIMLNNSTIYNTFTNGDNYYEAKEQKMTYFLPVDITSSRISSILTSGELWTGYVHPVTGTRPAWRQDPEDDEHEHLHPSEWAGCGDNPGASSGRHIEGLIPFHTRPMYYLHLSLMLM